MRKQHSKLKNPNEAKRQRRKLSIRAKVSGSTERPRVCINRTNKNIRVQVVDDSEMKTLFSVATFGKSKVEGSANKEAGKMVGVKVAEGLKSRNINSIVFDRSGYLYHGVVAEVANAIRENGISF